MLHDWRTSALGILLPAVLLLPLGCGGYDVAPPGAEPESEEAAGAGEAEDLDALQDPEGWREFGEVVGDESFMKARTQPMQPSAAGPTKIEAVVGSVYGRPKPKLWVRLTGPDRPSDPQDPTVGPQWTAMELVGGRIEDLNTGEMVPLGKTQETPSEEQMGESHYEAELAFPSGKSTIEFTVLAEWPDAKPAVFPAWDVTVP
jgi:hypothetical protein